MLQQRLLTTSSDRNEGKFIGYTQRTKLCDAGSGQQSPLPPPMAQVHIEIKQSSLVRYKECKQVEVPIDESNKQEDTLEKLNRVQSIQICNEIR